MSGSLCHEVNLGNGSITKPSEIQRMSVGTGICKSEMNAPNCKPVHFLQIWILPERQVLPPSYEQVPFLPKAGQGGFTLIAGPSGGDGAVTLNQDAYLTVVRPEAGDKLDLRVKIDRKGFLQVVETRVSVGANQLDAGDGLEIEAAFSARSLGKPTVRFYFLI